MTYMFHPNPGRKLATNLYDICHMFQPDPARKPATNLYDTYHCWVYNELTPDDGQRHCPKHAEFHAKNKFAKLVHLVGLIVKKLYCHVC
jgi:hypothetical protein